MSVSIAFRNTTTKTTIEPGSNVITHQCCQHNVNCQVDNINSTSTWAKITWAINGKEYNYSPDSENLIPPPKTRVLDEVKEESLNGNNQGIDGYNMITSFFTFQGTLLF